MLICVDEACINWSAWKNKRNARISQQIWLGGLRKSRWQLKLWDEIPPLFLHAPHKWHTSKSGRVWVQTRFAFPPLDAGQWVKIQSSPLNLMPKIWSGVSWHIWKRCCKKFLFILFILNVLRVRGTSHYLLKFKTGKEQSRPAYFPSWRVCL